MHVKSNDPRKPTIEKASLAKAVKVVEKTAKKKTPPAKKEEKGESVRSLAHRLILAGKLPDAEIHAAMCKLAGKELPRAYVSWYRSELKRLGVKKVPAAKAKPVAKKEKK